MKYGAIHVPDSPSLVTAIPFDRVRVAAPWVEPDWFADCPEDDDPLLNDELSCCCPAADMRLIQAWKAQRGVQWTIPHDLVRLRYEAVAGYQGTPDTDIGTIVAEDMFNWQSVPIIDDAGETFAAHWVTVQPAQTLNALRRGPVLATIAISEGEDDPDDWTHKPLTAAANYHRVLLGATQGGLFLARTYGFDVLVHPDRIVAADLMIPHAAADNPALAMAGIDFAKITT